MEEKSLNTKTIFTEWVNEHSDHLYSWALHKTSSKEVAEDLVQETFLSAYNTFENFKNESAPKTWLLSILNNKIIDYYRKKSRSLTNVDVAAEQQAIKNTDDLFDDNEHWKINSQNHWEDDKHLLDNHEFNSIMEKCVDHLPEKWKIAIQSKYLLDKNADDICIDLKVTITNYWQIIHRAKLQLKICIDKNWKS